MRIVKDPDLRKQEILDASIKVFARKGYDKTSITDIAKEIGISQGLCYRYFSSKEEIYDAAIEEYADFIISQNAAKTSLKGLTLKQQIMEMSGRINEYSDTEKSLEDLYSLFHKAGNHKMHDQLFLKVCQKLVPVIKKVLDDAVYRGEVKISDTDTAAYFFVYGQLGILMSSLVTEEDKTRRIQNYLIEMLGI